VRRYVQKSMTPRHALARLVTPLVWRVPGHGARKLYGFARAEQASRIDLLGAAQRTPSLSRRAAYLRHALDETRHTGMFWRRSTELRLEEARAPFPPPVADTEDLFERLGERRFLAFVHRGEQRGRAQFELYARHFARRGDARTGALFEAILTDELRHEAYTRALLVELCGGERAARAELARAALWEAWRTWRRAGRAIAGAVYALAMTLIYLVAGPVAAIGLRAGKRRARWQLPAPAAPARAERAEQVALPGLARGERGERGELAGPAREVGR
jgi:rubrerythrin